MQENKNYYSKLAVEPWDAAQAWLTTEQFHGYLIGSAIAYLARVNVDLPGKGGSSDITKACSYLRKWLEVYDT